MEFTEKAVEQIDQSLSVIRWRLMKISAIIATKESSKYITEYHIIKAEDLLWKTD